MGSVARAVDYPNIQRDANDLRDMASMLVTCPFLVVVAERSNEELYRSGICQLPGQHCGPAVAYTS